MSRQAKLIGGECAGGLLIEGRGERTCRLVCQARELDAISSYKPMQLLEIIIRFFGRHPPSNLAPNMRWQQKSGFVGIAGAESCLCIGFASTSLFVRYARMAVAIPNRGGCSMAKRKLSPHERREIGRAAAAGASAARPHRIVRVLVSPRTNEAGQPQIAVTSAPSNGPPRKPN